MSNKFWKACRQPLIILMYKWRQASAEPALATFIFPCRIRPGNLWLAIHRVWVVITTHSVSGAIRAGRIWADLRPTKLAAKHELDRLRFEWKRSGIDIQEEVLIPFQLHRRIPFVRRPFFQRDQAIQERDKVTAELMAIKTGMHTVIADGHSAGTRLYGPLTLRNPIRLRLFSLFEPEIAPRYTALSTGEGGSYSMPIGGLMKAGPAYPISKRCHCTSCWNSRLGPCARQWRCLKVNRLKRSPVIRT